MGSITALVDQTGNIAQTYRYDSLGNIINQTGSLNQPYTYTGREYDPETGLYYYRARYMDPKTGRFLQEDPVWATNLYPYVGNNPLNLIDPYGLLGIRGTRFWIPAGEIFGEEAAAYWAQRQVETGNILYSIPGVLASAWTCETSNITAGTLLLGGATAGWAAKTGPVISWSGMVGIINAIMYKTIITPRSTLGADGGISQMVHTVNRFTGATIKVVHQVIKNGKIIHSDVKFP